MKIKFLCVFISILAITANLFSIFYEILWLKHFSGIIFVVGLLSYHVRKLSRENLNFYGFIAGLFAANVTTFFSDVWFFSHVALGFWLVCFFFIIKEAIQVTEYNKGSHYMQLYFVLVVVVYAYLLSLHMIEMEDGMASTWQFLIYYIKFVDPGNSIPCLLSKFLLKKVNLFYLFCPCPYFLRSSSGHGNVLL